MEVSLDPIDVMVYEYQLVEFLGRDRVERELSSFVESIQSKSEEPGFPTQNSNIPQHRQEPFLSKLYKSRKAFDQYWLNGSLPVFQHLLDLTMMGHAVTELNDIEIVDPEGKILSKDIQDVYANRIWHSDNLWDAIFELEIGALLHEFDLTLRLVDEGTIGGPDIQVGGFKEPVWVECKRKRKPTDEETEWEKFKKGLKDQVWNNIDIGNDSFAVQISADFELKTGHLEEVSRAIASVIDSRDDQTTVQLDEGEAIVELLSYYDGAHVIDLTENQEGGLGIMNLSHIEMEDAAKVIRPTQGSEAITADLYGHLGLRWDYGEKESTGVVRKERISETEIKVRNAMMFIFELPRNIDYLSKILSAIDSAKSNLAGYSPSMVCVHVPYSWLKEMEQMPSADSPQTMQDERLQQRIDGELNSNSTINAIVPVTRFPLIQPDSKVSISRIGEPQINPNPQQPLPREMERFLDQLVHGSNENP